MALDMFKESLKFQAAEKEANQQQTAEQQEDSSELVWKGPQHSWKLSYTHWKRRLAKLKTEFNFPVLFKSWGYFLHRRTAY